ncbi:MULTISPECIES: MazG-like family protein [Streptococcus]|jgi:NTP pyrophosphatase (non-canonical NTP hydrolase)|uniref:MazG-like family protein n=1 Tax=Streptococcus TaxID=1301 RepID=UPI00076FB6C0|nr:MULTISPECIES: MazG-like family protein [Streptococcus]KXI11955.1 hypothetical protein HMPREF3205_01532 [Streptococcus pasteurianus]MDU7847475.1 MazG-like family protein [Streptococcus sp.]DAM71751.1 MAG TPA: NTP-PPase-like protein [Bacteriophage sp.]
MEFNELVENVKAWSIAKGLDKAEPIKQMQKLSEEWGELNQAKAKSNPEQLKDSIGDVLVVLIILGQQMNLNDINELVNANLYKERPEEIGLFGASIDKLLLLGTAEIGRIASVLTINGGENEAKFQKMIIERSIVHLADFLDAVAIKENTSTIECFEFAWNEIKGRTGQMVNGVFVKSEDIKE